MIRKQSQGGYPQLCPVPYKLLAWCVFFKSGLLRQNLHAIKLILLCQTLVLSFNKCMRSCAHHCNRDREVLLVPKFSSASLQSNSSLTQPLKTTQQGFLFCFVLSLQFSFPKMSYQQSHVVYNRTPRVCQLLLDPVHLRLAHVILCSEVCFC